MTIPATIEPKRHSRPPSYIPLPNITAAAASADRLSNYGLNVEAVTFTTNGGIFMVGRDCNDLYDFSMTVDQETDEIGTVTAKCEFKSERLTKPLRFSAGCDDLVSALLLAIDEQAHAL